MASILKGGEIGAEIGAALGPEGEIVGAGVGGLAGLAASIGRVIRNEPDPEQQPLLRRPAPRNIFGSSPTGAAGLRQRPPPIVAGRERNPASDPDIMIDIPLSPVRGPPDTFQPRRPLSDVRNLPKKIGVGAAVGAAIAGTIGVATSGGHHYSFPHETLPPDTPVNQPEIPVSTPAQDPAITPETVINPETPVSQQKPIFSPLSTADYRGYIGNYRLPVAGRHDFITWTKFTEGNTIASQY